MEQRKLTKALEIFNQALSHNEQQRPRSSFVVFVAGVFVCEAPLYRQFLWTLLVAIHTLLDSYYQVTIPPESKNVRSYVPDSAAHAQTPDR
jgi:hypothetical protein